MPMLLGKDASHLLLQTRIIHLQQRKHIGLILKGNFIEQWRQAVRQT